MINAFTEIICVILIAPQDPAYASFLFDKLQRLQCPRRGRHASPASRCDVCGTTVQHLRHLALCQALGTSRRMTPRPATPNMATSVCPPPAMETAYEGDKHQAKQQGWTQDGQQLPSGAPFGWGGVQSTYLGGGGAKGLATVTPLNAHSYLEGVWRVTCCKHEHATVSRKRQKVRLRMKSYWRNSDGFGDSKIPWKHLK